MFSFATFILFILSTNLIDNVLKIAVGVATAAISYWIVRYFNTIKDERDKAKKERDEMCERIENIEDLIKVDNPAFQAMRADMKSLTEIVKNHHETRMTGIVNDVANMKDLYNYRLTQTDGTISEIKRTIEKVIDKVDENAKISQGHFEKLLEEITKRNNKQ